MKSAVKVKKKREFWVFLGYNIHEAEYLGYFTLADMRVRNLLLPLARRNIKNSNPNQEFYLHPGERKGKPKEKWLRYNISYNDFSRTAYFHVFFKKPNFLKIKWLKIKEKVSIYLSNLWWAIEHEYDAFKIGMTNGKSLTWILKWRWDIYTGGKRRL